MVYRSIRVLSLLCMMLPHTVHTAQKAVKTVSEDLIQVLAENNTTIMQQWIDTKKTEADRIYFGAPLLYFAVWMQSEPDIPRLLLQAGAQVDGRPHGNCNWEFAKNTPLFEATVREKWPIVELLLSYGADAGADNLWNDNHSYTPHDITITNNVMDGRVASYFSPDKRTTNPFWHIKGALLLCNNSASAAMKLATIRAMQLHEKQAILKIMQGRRMNQSKKGDLGTERDVQILARLGDEQAQADLGPISEATHMIDALSDMVIDYWLE